MTTAVYPPLPDVPACWSWELPPFPQRCSIGVIARWQADRCAVCGVVPPERLMRNYETPRWMSGLFEDHDHATGDTRGYLCPRCNTAEGRRNAYPMFALYRERYPTKMLGILHRKGSNEHPEVRNARYAWESALSSLDIRQREEEEYRRSVEACEWLGLPAPELLYGLTFPPTPLMVAAMRVGLTQDEWFGEEPDMPHRWRYRAGLEHTSTEWAEIFRKDLADWARALRAPRPEVGSRWVSYPDEPDNRSRVTITEITWGGSEWFVHVVAHDATRWEPAGATWDISLRQSWGMCVPDQVPSDSSGTLAP